MKYMVTSEAKTFKKIEISVQLENASEALAFLAMLNPAPVAVEKHVRVLAQHVPTANVDMACKCAEAMMYNLYTQVREHMNDNL